MMGLTDSELVGSVLKGMKPFEEVAVGATNMSEVDMTNNSGMTMGDTIFQGTPISDITVTMELPMGIENLIGAMMGASVILSTIEVAGVVLDLDCSKVGTLWFPIKLSRYNLCPCAQVAYSKNKCVYPKGILESYDFEIHTCDT